MNKYRLSKYSIITKLDENNKYMLVHGYTGAIDIVSEDVAVHIETDKLFSKEEIPFSNETFDTLVSRGYLTTKTPDEEYEYVAGLSNIFHRVRKASQKNFMFLVAYDCNFRCPYCYENSISQKGRQWSKKTFTKEMVDKAYDAMLKIENNRDLHFNTITLYGGEPLLYKNKEIVKYIINKGKSLGYTFSAVTNGYDLHHFVEFLDPSVLYELQITLDGVKERHNKTRIHYKDKDTFDRICNNIGIALKKGVSISIRVNVEKNNFEDLKLLESSLKEYCDNPNFSIYSALLMNYNPESPKPKSSIVDYMSRKEFNQRNEEIDFKYGCQDGGLTKRLSHAIQKGVKMNFGSVFCGAQVGMYIFDPFGEIYGCWNTVGDSKEVLGRYDNDILEWTQNLDLWLNKNVGNSPICGKCKYALFCQGGCLSKAQIYNNDYKIPYCDEYQHTFKTVLNKLFKTL